ncbi:hypothetical protein DSO57_1023255 [Entomophthora muscae]|uniref:Uncharacterized protein n=1 Tax=Entomophthora muscae TaxID=34485 RepID=A0ACC2S518_9FUNG|nr:hypothetical protein DSO57_1023255 [Entomophthora muscae]
MTPPLTPWPNCPQETVTTAESTSTQPFGVLYITLTGLVDFMVPANGPWAFLRKSLSYIVKLALILWWALPTGPVSSPEPATGWLPDRGPEISSLIKIMFPVCYTALYSTLSYQKAFYKLLILFLGLVIKSPVISEFEVLLGAWF